MTLQISQYVDPGVYVQEVIVPGALNIATVPVLPTIIATGARTSRATNEAVVRGLVSGETLTLAGTAPHTATLANRGTRRLSNTTVFKDGIALSDSFVSYPAATALGTEAGTFDLSSPHSFGIKLDGKLPLTLVLEYNAAPAAVSVDGAVVTVQASFSGAGGNAATRTEIASAINDGLAAATATALGVDAPQAYGSGYSNVASDGTTGIRLTSPMSSPASNVEVFASIEGALDVTALFGAGSLQAETVIQIAPAAYSASAVFTVDYVGLDDTVDTLAQDGPRTFQKVGAFPGVGTFQEDIDFEVDGSSDLNWASVDIAASFDSLTGDFDLSSNDVLRLSFDGKAAILVDLDGLSPAPLGYADPADASNATASEVANNINAVFNANENYGSEYRAVASASGNVVTLTSPLSGAAGSLTVSHPAANDATQEIFGLGSATNRTVTGTGSRPALGSVYYASYDYPRAAADYNNPRQVFTLDQAFAFTGPLSENNELAVAADISFRNRAPSCLLVQVNDASDPGNPSRLEIQDALTAVESRSTATDICVLNTDLGVQVDLLQHVENMSGPVEKNYRRGWFGMPRGTSPGDVDTEDTYVFRATQTLQVAPTSPGRGRMILVASPGPEGINKTITREDGTTATLQLDSSWLALACASRMASFSSPAETLARKTITGFDINEGSFTPWVRGERATMADNGVTVVTFDAGRFILLDPVTTEKGGGGLVSFVQISASTQKDNISRKVTLALDSNIVGIVPTDLADFIIDIKQFISNVLEGEIGAGAIAPFSDDNGNTRAIDLQRDIVVEQDPNDPTKYFFKYFFNLRYPALRLFGEFSVDNPFFSNAG